MAESEHQHTETHDAGNGSQPNASASETGINGIVRRNPGWSIATAIALFMVVVVVAGLGESPEEVTVQNASKSSVQWSGTEPKLDASPGSVADVETRDICAPNYVSSVKPASSKTQAAVFKAYGIKDKAQFENYSITPVIPIELGGATSAKNLWPLSTSAADTVKVRSELTSHIRELVCTGQVELPSAQRAFQGGIDVAKAQFAAVVVTTTTTSTSTTTTTSTTLAPTTTSTTATSKSSGTSSSGRGYTNVDGNHVPSPVKAPSAPAGATAQCRDGTYSFSQNRRGTCSHHGGVQTWL